VTRDVADVEGGAIGRDPAGALTGLLRDNAMALVWRAVPPTPPAMADRALDAAMRHVAAQGVTAVQAMGSWDDLAVYERAWAAGRLGTRVSAHVPLETWAQLADTVRAWEAAGRARHGRLVGDAWLRIGGLKGFVDGSLGAHTAAMLAPFSDAPQDRGLYVTPPESLLAWTTGADAAGLQVAVHAIGDAANRTMLDTYARVLQANGGAADARRWRIEHAQHSTPPTCRASPRSASSPACSRTTRSTTGGGPTG
jgi:predicted amidohydrolase YtcJ